MKLWTHSNRVPSHWIKIKEIVLRQFPFGWFTKNTGIVPHQHFAALQLFIYLFFAWNLIEEKTCQHLYSLVLNPDSRFNYDELHSKEWQHFFSFIVKPSFNCFRLSPCEMLQSCLSLCLKLHLFELLQWGVHFQLFVFSIIMGKYTVLFPQTWV